MSYVGKPSSLSHSLSDFVALDMIASTVMLISDWSIYFSFASLCKLAIRKSLTASNYNRIKIQILRRQMLSENRSLELIKE